MDQRIAKSTVACMFDLDSEGSVKADVDPEFGVCACESEVRDDSMIGGEKKMPRYGAVLSLPVSLLLCWGVTELFEKPLAKRMRYKDAAPAP